MSFYIVQGFLATMIDGAAGGLDQRRPYTRKISEDELFDPMGDASMLHVANCSCLQIESQTEWLRKG
jgi:hypothetical protein